MHMSDALLSPVIGGITWAGAVGAAAYTSRKVKADFNVPLAGVMGAFVFAAQMINFSIPFTGSSGHIGGGLLLAILLGPEIALLTMMSVLMIQAMFFADGGLLAYGANVLNMGVITTLLVYPLVYKPLIKRLNPQIATVLSAVIGLELGAFAVVVETTLSGVTALPFADFVVAMLPVHLAIGAVEGIITAAVVAFVKPHISIANKGTRGLRDHLITGLVVVTLIVGGLMSWFASDKPDGLEYATENTASQELVSKVPWFESFQAKVAILPDYASPHIISERIGTSLSGVVGSILTGLVLLGILTYMKRKRKMNA